MDASLLSKTMPLEGLSFGSALVLLRYGWRLQREGWNGKGMYIALQKPDAQSANKQPYIYIVPVCGERVPWVASQPDLLAIDWKVVDEDGK